MRRPKYVLLALSSLALSVPAAAETPAPIAKAIADTSRPADQRSTDPVRQPAETLAFSGVKSGMVVGEFYPGGGYFTRMLSDVVGPKGHVYAIENAAWKNAGEADTALVDALPVKNVSVKVAPFGTVDFPRPLDLAWITQNYHDLKIAKYGVVDTAAFNAGVFAALKPGGIFLIVDHEAPAGTTVAGIEKLHRIERAQVIREVTAAGFRLIAEGDFLRHKGDDHSLSVFDKAIQGKTDQYALKFMKPKG